MNEKLSTIERMWEADKRRQTGPSIANIVKKSPLEAVEAQQINALARAVPDSEVMHLQEVRQLASTARVDASRVDYLSRLGEGQRVKQLMASMEKELAAARENLPMAALDDAAAGDDQFSGYWVLCEEVKQLEQKVEAARVVNAFFNGGFRDSTVRMQAKAKADKSRAAFEVAAMAAKRDVVLARTKVLGDTAPPTVTTLVTSPVTKEMPEPEPNTNESPTPAV